MRTMTCLIGAEHDIAVHLCNFIKDSRGSSRVLPYHAQKKGINNKYICVHFNLLRMTYLRCAFQMLFR